MAEEYASLNPEEHVEGGGLLNDETVTFANVKFSMFAYGGKSNVESPCIVANFLGDDDALLRGTQGDYLESWSCGKSNEWQPTPDGKRLMRTGAATAIRNTSKGSLLLQSLFNNGFPKDRLKDDISILDGLKAHVYRQTMKLEGLEREAGQRDPTVLLVDKIISLPWEKESAKGKSKGKEKEADSEMEEAVTAAVLEIIDDAGGKIAKKKLTQEVFNKMKSHPKRNEAVQLANSDEFLSAGPWEFAGGEVSMG